MYRRYGGSYAPDVWYVFKYIFIYIDTFNDWLTPTFMIFILQIGRSKAVLHVVVLLYPLR